MFGVVFAVSVVGVVFCDAAVHRICLILLCASSADDGHFNSDVLRLVMLAVLLVLLIHLCSIPGVPISLGALCPVGRLLDQATFFAVAGWL